SATATAPPASDTPFPLDDPKVFADLRDVLVRHGYTAKGLEQAMGEKNAGHLLTWNLSLVKRRLPPGQPVSTLIRLFRMGSVLPASEVRAAFAPLSVERLAELGLLEVRGDEVASPFDIRMHEGLYCLNDRRTHNEFPNY